MPKDHLQSHRERHQVNLLNPNLIPNPNPNPNPNTRRAIESARVQACLGTEEEARRAHQVRLGRTKPNRHRHRHRRHPHPHPDLTPTLT